MAMCPIQLAVRSSSPLASLKRDLRLAQALKVLHHHGVLGQKLSQHRVCGVQLSRRVRLQDQLIVCWEELWIALEDICGWWVGLRQEIHDLSVNHVLMLLAVCLRLGLVDHLLGLLILDVLLLLGRVATVSTIMRMHLRVRVRSSRKLT